MVRVINSWPFKGCKDSYVKSCNTSCFIFTHCKSVSITNKLSGSAVRFHFPYNHYYILLVWESHIGWGNIFSLPYEKENLVWTDFAVARVKILKFLNLREKPIFILENSKFSWHNVWFPWVWKGNSQFLDVEKSPTVCFNFGQAAKSLFWMVYCFCREDRFPTNL